MEGGSQQQQQQQQQHQQHVEPIAGHADITSILDQIMTITDQSLDEAQVKH